VDGPQDTTGSCSLCVSSPVPFGRWERGQGYHFGRAAALPFTDASTDRKFVARGKPTEQAKRGLIQDALDESLIPAYDRGCHLGGATPPH